MQWTRGRCKTHEKFAAIDALCADMMVFCSPGSSGGTGRARAVPSHTMVSAAASSSLSVAAVDDEAGLVGDPSGAPRRSGDPAPSGPCLD